MRLWRKLASVLAGGMIAAGGLVGALVVLEATAPQTAPGNVPQYSQWLFEPNAAQSAVSGDVATVGDWLNQAASSSTPVDAATAHDAAIAAAAIAEIASGGGTGTTQYDRGAVFAPAATEASASGEQAAINADDAYYDTNAAATSAEPTTTEAKADRVEAAVSVLYTASALRVFGQSEASLNLTQSATDLFHTPLTNASATVDSAPTAEVALLALAPHPVPEHLNWTAAATAEITERAQGGVAGQDTFTLALTSQAVRTQEPSTASAINAELRYRQRTDGSFGGDIRATSEAVRALADGNDADRLAAGRALDWLDAQTALSATDASYRLRAHAVAGELTNAAPPSSVAASGGGLEMSGSSALGILAFLSLAGGIGLSLTLVTDDALKGARRRLYDTIRAEPGLHVNELRRRLTMSPSSIEYHLAVLTGAGLVISEDDGRYKRFYANGAGLGLNPGSPNSRNTLGALRRPHAIELVQHMLERGDATAREVSRTLGLHESAASRRLDHLERAGLLISERVGRERRYKVRDRQAAIKALTLVEAQVAPAPAMAAATEPTNERGSNEPVPAGAASP